MVNIEKKHTLQSCSHNSKMFWDNIFYMSENPPTFMAISLSMFQIDISLHGVLSLCEGCNVIIIQREVLILMQIKLMIFINSNTIVAIYSSIICMLGLNSGTWLEFSCRSILKMLKSYTRTAYIVFTFLKDFHNLSTKNHK